MASTRRLAAIVFTDLEGFTRLAQEDERGALKLLAEQEQLIGPLLAAHHGRKIKSMGDGLLLEFPNARDAVEWAVEFQRAVRERDALGGSRSLSVRVGIHVGDVEQADSDILGDAVNIAARIEPLAEPGGVCISRPVYDQVHNKLAFPLVSLGARPLKNVKEPLEVFKVVLAGSGAGVTSMPEVDRNRIAILPLANFSPDPGDAYFADGLTDEIISTVSGIGGLTVISRTSAMRYKQTSKSMTEIGRELRAGKLLEGSVRKSGNKVRVTVQLIDSESDAHLWAQSYDGNLDNVFETQSDIARKIAEALKLPTPAAGGRPEHPSSYALWLQARTLWNKRTPEANEQAILLFTDALKVDPNSARVTAGLARCYTTAEGYGWMDKKEAHEKAEPLVRHALELDETVPDAHLARADLIAGSDWPGAEAEIKRALALNPSDADSHQWYGSILRGMGRLDEALVEARKAYDLDPLPASRQWFVAVSAFFADRNEEAMSACTKLIQTEPGFAAAYLGRAVLTSIKGDREQAYRALQTYRKLTNELAYLSLQARVEAHLGNKTESARLVDEALSRFEAGQTAETEDEGYPYQVSFACALIGDSERFFRVVNYLVDHKLMGPGELRDPSYRSMSRDPRFGQILQKVRRSYGIPD